MRRAFTVGAACVSGALVAPAAQAHLLVTGMGPPYDGITHFASSPEDFLPLAALAFLAGLRSPTQARRLFFAVPLAWFAGGALALGNLVPPAIALSSGTAALFIVIGGLLAAKVDAPSAAVIVLATLLGTVRGMADFADVGATAPRLWVLIGVCGSVAVVCALATSVTLTARRPWMIAAARVFGSWTAALGLLLVGWLVRFGAVG